MGNDHGFLDSLLDLIFAKDKTRVYLLLIFIVGLILRIIAAINLDVAADDMHFAPHAINFLSSGKLVTYDQSASLWFLDTDVFYKLLGNTQLASRLAGVIFGALSIIVIFLLTKEFFSEKIALIASFLLAFSPFVIKMMMSEMDVMAMFFVFFGIWFFINSLKTDKNKGFIWAGIFIGLGTITKLYSLFFIPCLIAYALYCNKKRTGKIYDKELGKKLFFLVVFAGIFFLPAIIHNYTLYKDKGFLDLQFTRVFNLGKEKSAQYYAWDHQFTAKPDFKGFLFGNSKNLAGQGPTSLVALSFIYYPDPIIFFLGVLGLLLMLRKNKNYVIFFFLLFAFPFVYLASIILLPKHYLFVLMLLTPAAAFSLNSIVEKIETKIQRKHFFIFLAIFYLVLLGFGVPMAMKHVYGKSSIAQLMDFKKINIPSDSMVIADSRMYRGDITWAFSDRHFIEASFFWQVVSLQQNISGIPVNTPVYFIECARDDCGWGNVKDQPEFNQTMEEIVSFFKNNSQEIGSFNRIINEKYYFPLIKSGDGEPYYRVYKTDIALKPATLELIDSSHSWFLYPLAYKGEIFDKPRVSGVNFLLYQLARAIQYTAIVLSFFSIILAFKLLIEEKKDEKEQISVKAEEVKEKQEDKTGAAT